MTGTVITSADLEERLTIARQALRTGEFSVAHPIFLKLVQILPEDPAPWDNLGQCLEKMGDLSGAAQAYNNAISVSSKYFPALMHLGDLLIGLGENDQAISVLLNAIDANPSSDQARRNLGAAYLNTQRYTEAADSFHKALAFNPKDVTTLVNLGTCLREQGKPEAAIQTYETARSIVPDSSEATTRLASTLSDTGKPDEALRILNDFLDAYPDDAESHQNKALILLRNGNMEDGLDEYEWRFYPTSHGIPPRPFNIPTWKGEDLGHRKLLIWLEQGIGDALLSLGLLRKHLDSVRPDACLVECDPRLVQLVSRSFPTVQVIPKHDPPMAETKTADVACAAWSAVRLLKQSKTSRLEQPGYLQPNPDQTRTFREKYEALAQGRTIVGLSWASNSARGRLKTPPLKCWAPILSDDQHFFVSLQYAASEQDTSGLAEFAAGRFYCDPSLDATIDLDKNASQVAALDAVVTISNTTAHMAGGIGIPVATLVPKGYGGFWYWLRKQTDSPWYPSMHICRQKHPGDWVSATAQAKAWLTQLSLHSEPLS